MSDKKWWQSYSGYYGGGYSSRDRDDDDWDYGSGFGRRSRYRSSLGWGAGKLLDTTTSYSSSKWYGSGYYTSSVSAEKSDEVSRLVTKAYRATRDMIVILDFPFDVEIQFSADSFVSKPGGRRIFIPTTVLDRSDYDEQEKITIFCGLGIHEAAHLKYTTYSVLSGFEDRIKALGTFNVDGKDITITRET